MQLSQWDGTTKASIKTDAFRTNLHNILQRIYIFSSSNCSRNRLVLIAKINLCSITIKWRSISNRNIRKICRMKLILFRTLSLIFIKMRQVNHSLICSCPHNTSTSRQIRINGQYHLPHNRRSYKNPLRQVIHRGTPMEISPQFHRKGTQHIGWENQ